MKRNTLTIEYFPLTPERWSDFEELFSRKNSPRDCWCMWWKLTRAEFEKNKGEANRRAMKEIVDSGRVPGILAYARKRPVAWCAIAPRPEFPRLQRSPLLKPVDDRRVWSVVCFFVDRDFRRQGLSAGLLKAALRHAAGRGALVVEGYPHLAGKEKRPDCEVYTGLHSTFAKAGFREVSRPSPNRSIMRYHLEAGT
ncbi:MAG: GNAT family N-acetyltransferase [Candidatus Glassbacteria bacterium]|nr:GNAT family N-acetyltransferase [Candidatus Glassbacteria bacterium]